MEASHTAQLADLESRAAAEAQQDSRQQDAAEGAEEHPGDAVAAALAANSLYGKTASAEKQVGPTLVSTVILSYDGLLFEVSYPFHKS